MCVLLWPRKGFVWRFWKGKLLAFSEKRTYKTWPSFRPSSMETTIQENAVGWRGWERTGRSLVLASGHGLLIPLPFQYKCIQALFINKYSSCLHQPPQNITWTCQSHLCLEPLDRPSLCKKCCLVAPGRAPFLSVVTAWRGWSCSESSLVLDDYIWFLFLFFWITILPIPSCLPPS